MCIPPARIGAVTVEGVESAKKWGGGVAAALAASSQDRPLVVYGVEAGLGLGLGSGADRGVHGSPLEKKKLGGVHD